MAQLYRQGDVLLVTVDTLPPDAVAEDLTDRIVLAYGEVTGHAHALDSSLAVAYKLGNERFIQALAGATIVHEEHGAIALPAGYYRVVRQREYTPAEIRQVSD